MWFIGVEVEQKTSAPPPKKNPGSAPGWPECVDVYSDPSPRKYRPWQPSEIRLSAILVLSRLRVSF